MNDDLYKYLEKYRDINTMKRIIEDIHAITTKEWNIMEVCGGQTFALAKYGIESLLPSKIKMIHGPGCPVCVTPKKIIDEAIDIASRDKVIFCSFGDMLRVPGSTESLLECKAKGGDIRLLYSPLDTIKIAEENPTKEIVFFAIGFETTMPNYALLLKAIGTKGIRNLSLLTSLFTIPPAVRALASEKDCKIDALLAAGHVCAITGEEEYLKMCTDLGFPIIITGFEPVDLLLGIYYAVKQLEIGECKVENPYQRIAHNNGNKIAQIDIKTVFEPSDTEWRGLGVIPKSGMRITKKYELYDSKKRFTPKSTTQKDSSLCISGNIMRGLNRPEDCSCFGSLCTPEHPIGAPMVSSEGVCAAYLLNKSIATVIN